MGKVIVISAPSGTGKGTVIARLRSDYPELRLELAISATSRPPRGTERHGVEYYFLSPEAFRAEIEAGNLLEWEEVYAGRYYGTLRSEVDRRLSSGANVLLELDYVGGLNVKRIYGDEALALFILPPSLEELRRRLEGRATDSPEMIAERLGKAELEMSHAPEFDKQVVNDDLERCVLEVKGLITEFLKLS